MVSIVDKYKQPPVDYSAFLKNRKIMTDDLTEFVESIRKPFSFLFVFFKKEFTCVIFFFFLKILQISVPRLSIALDILFLSW